MEYDVAVRSSSLTMLTRSLPLSSIVTKPIDVEVDGGVPAVVVPTARLPGLQPPVIVKPGG